MEYADLERMLISSIKEVQIKLGYKVLLSGKGTDKAAGHQRRIRPENQAGNGRL